MSVYPLMRNDRGCLCSDSSFDLIITAKVVMDTECEGGRPRKSVRYIVNRWCCNTEYQGDVIYIL